MVSFPGFPVIGTMEFKKMYPPNDRIKSTRICLYRSNWYRYVPVIFETLESVTRPGGYDDHIPIFNFPDYFLNNFNFPSRML